jgi:signal transduction histidine kinase
VTGFEHDPTRRPSSWWIVLSAFCVALTATSVVGAIVAQRESSRLIGEGEVFLADSGVARDLIGTTEDIDVAVRRARNALRVEAVSVLDRNGLIVASTSTPLAGESVDDPLIAMGASEGRLMALAAAINSDLELDGVVRWPAGTVLYQVVAPLGSARAVLLHYDVSQLLARRAANPGPGSMPTQLLGLAGIFAILAAAVLVGHTRAMQRHRTMSRESEIHRINSLEMSQTNASLEQARHQAEEALALAEEKIRIRSEFVLMINHELRTPLTSVVTGAELLRSRDLSDSDRSALLDAMVADGSRLQEIIDQILAVARIENRGLSYELTDTPVAEIGRALSLAQLAASAEIELDGASGTVHTDVGALCLVVGSLVDNAFTHGARSVAVGCALTPRVEPQMEVGTRPASAIYVTVADDGPGIDHEFLPRIFEKFEKSSFSPGTGLGLYMARMIVEALEGSLGVHTSAEGTTFQISIPASATRDRVGAMR